MAFVFCRKIPKTLSGIETENLPEMAEPEGDERRKIPKTLSGIETGRKAKKLAEDLPENT